jgi:hypothetical protein
VYFIRGRPVLDRLSLSGTSYKHIPPALCVIGSNGIYRCFEQWVVYFHAQYDHIAFGNFKEESHDENWGEQPNQPDSSESLSWDSDAEF